MVTGMIQARVLLSVATLSLVVSLSACFKPLDAKLDEIPKLATIEEVMRANETVGGRLWKRGGAGSYADADWSEFRDDGAKLAALAERSKNFSRGPAYDKYAAQMATLSAELGAAADAKDAAKVDAAVDALKATCKSCHSETK
jgi:cytochrome c553